jgi:hypothetical protein
VDPFLRHALIRALPGQWLLCAARRRGFARGNPNAVTHSNLLYAFNFLPGASPEEIWTEHRH